MSLSTKPYWQSNLEVETGAALAGPDNLAGPVELTPQELDMMEQHPALPEARQAVEMVEYTPEEMDRMAAQYEVEEFDPVALDKMEVMQLHEPSLILPKEEWLRLRQLEADLKKRGELPSGLDVAKEALGGLLVTAADAFNSATWEVPEEQGWFSVDGRGVNPARSVQDSWSRLNSTLQVGGSRMVVNVMQLGQWAKNALEGTPRFRVEETGEFIFGGAVERDGVMQPTFLDAIQADRPGQTIRPVTSEDMEEFEYQRWVNSKPLKQVYEELGEQQLQPDILYQALTAFQDTAPRAANPSQATVAEIVTDPLNLASFGAGTITTGAFRGGLRLSARSTDLLRKAAGGAAAGVEGTADAFTSAITRVTGATRQTQATAAKWAAGGGAAGTIGAVGFSDSIDPNVKKALFGAMAFYPAYKMGLGTLRKIERGSAGATVILREAADASRGLDQAARAAIIANPEVPDIYRAVLANPNKFLSVESTPARLAEEVALSPQTRAFMEKLASPLIVQSVRGTRAVTGGAVKGAVANAPFAALAANSDEDDMAAAMLGLGAAFGAAGGGASRLTGLRARRQQAAVADVARMLVDAELAGGDAAALTRSMTPDGLVKLAAMQGAFRGGVDFVPLNAADYALNVQANGGAGSAGLFVQAPAGQRARIFINTEATAGGIAPHEFGHALIASGALGGAQQGSIRGMVQARYGADGVEARAREYATRLIDAENRRAFPDENRPPSEAQIKAKMDELSEQGAARGDMDGLDWARDEIFAEEFSKASDLMDFAAIRRNYGGPLSGFTEFAEGVLGAQSRALAASGVRIDPDTGRALDTPAQLFQNNPILGTDKALLKNLQTYISNYRKWIHNPDAVDAKPRGIPVMPRGAADVAGLANNPHVRFYDRGDGVMQNEFARIDPATGQAVLRDPAEIAAETKKRQAQIKQIIGSRVKGPQDTELGMRRTADGRTVVTGRTLPSSFDFLNGFSPHIREFARGFEQMGNTGESMLVRYHAIGSGDSGAFKVKNLGNLEAIQREVVPFGWQLSKQGNILAQVLDVTSLRTRALRSINARSDALAPFNWDMKEFDAGLKTWMRNHREGRAGETGIGVEKRDAIDAMVGIGTKMNRSRNPLAGSFGPGSAIKTFRLDRVDAMMGTGRTGFHFDYDKANGNFMPETGQALPDMSVPVRGVEDAPVPELPNLDGNGKSAKMSERNNFPKNAFGGPSPDARIEASGWGLGGARKNTSTFYLEAADDWRGKIRVESAKHKTPEEAFNDAVRQAEELGYKVVEISKDAYGAPVARLRHEAAAELKSEIAKSIDQQIKSLKARVEKEGKSTFLRYGKPPESGRSYNGKDGFYEVGVSVYPAIKLKGGEYVLNMDGMDGISSMFIQAQKGGEIFEVSGAEVLGRGADGEPLLRGGKYRKIPRNSRITPLEDVPEPKIK